MSTNEADTYDPVLVHLRKLREARGLSQFDVAEQLGFSTYHSYARIENGETRLTLPTLRQLATYFRVPLADLVDPEAARVKQVAEEAAPYSASRKNQLIKEQATELLALIKPRVEQLEQLVNMIEN